MKATITSTLLAQRLGCWGWGTGCPLLCSRSYWSAWNPMFIERSFRLVNRGAIQIKCRAHRYTNSLEQYESSTGKMPCLAGNVYVGKNSMLLTWHPPTAVTIDLALTWHSPTAVTSDLALTWHHLSHECVAVRPSVDYGSAVNHRYMAVHFSRLRALQMLRLLPDVKPTVQRRRSGGRVLHQSTTYLFMYCRCIGRNTRSRL